MSRIAYSWAAQQLTEYLTALGTCEDVPCALQLGVDRAAEAFEADAGAVVRDGETLARIGHVEVPTVTAKLDDTTHLVLAREDAFTVDRPTR